MNPRPESLISKRLSSVFPGRMDLESSTLWMGESVSADWGGEASRLWMFTYLTDPGFLATDSMEAYFRAIGPILGYYKSGNGKL